MQAIFRAGYPQFVCRSLLDLYTVYTYTEDWQCGQSPPSAYLMPRGSHCRNTTCAPISELYRTSVSSSPHWSPVIWRVSMKKHRQIRHRAVFTMNTVSMTGYLIQPTPPDAPFPASQIHRRTMYYGVHGVLH